METFRFKKGSISNFELPNNHRKNTAFFTCPISKGFRISHFIFSKFDIRYLIFFIVPLWVQSAEIEQHTPSTITNVTVFLNQAQVTRIAKVNLQAGITNLVFDHLSSQINKNSIQVRVDGNITLLAVSSKEDFLHPPKKSAALIALEDSLKVLTNALNNFKADKETIVFQKELMLANKNVGSNQIGVKSEELEDLMQLYKKKLNEFKEDWFRLTQLETNYQAYKQNIENQLNEFNVNAHQTSPEVVITLKTLSPVYNAAIELSYLVYNASWVPFYDVRVKDTKSELQLVAKAFITQSTGENWKNVILKLSTVNPNEGGNKPELTTNFIGFHNPQYDAIQISGKPQSYSSKAEETMMSDESSKRTGIASIQQTALNIEFNVLSAATIPSDNNPHQVDLTVQNLKATYVYGVVPKMDNDVFAMAKVPGNDLVNQISGEANIYFDGTFVGKSFINGTTSDSLSISLGRDKRIQIQRIQLKDFSSKTITGSSKKELSTWEINIRNTRKEPITIVVEDQIPVSKDKEIEIKLINTSGAEYDEITGKLKWLLVIAPEQSLSLKFSFELKYPKDKIISSY
jgi:uncharacterized protein (TIGR02231 family)